MTAHEIMTIKYSYRTFCRVLNESEPCFTRAISSYFSIGGTPGRRRFIARNICIYLETRYQGQTEMYLASFVMSSGMLSADTIKHNWV